MSMRDSILAARTLGPLLDADGTARIEFRFPAEDPTFAGHFPDRPLLPGVFQLEMTRAAAEWVLEKALVVREVARAKFLRPILPGELVRLDLKLVSAEDTIRAVARFSVEGQPAGEASLRLGRGA